jgi:hypothetical protein
MRRGRLQRSAIPSVAANLETSGAIKTVGAMYNLETGGLEFFD